MYIYSYMFKIQWLQSTLHLIQYTYWDFFPTGQNSFWTHWIWCLLVLLPFFCFTSFTLAKCFPLRTFFIWEPKIVAQGEIEWIGRVGHGGHAVFGQTLLNTQCSVNRHTHKSPIVKWANALSLHKKFTEVECNLSQQCQVVYTDRDGFLEHLPSRGSLYYKGSNIQKIILAFLGPCITCTPMFIAALFT